MFRKRKRKHKNRSNNSGAPYNVVYGYYDTDGSLFTSTKKKKKKKVTIMGLTPGALEVLCDSVQIRTDISIEKSY